MSEMVELGFKRIHPNARLPEKAHESDAGMDVYAIDSVRLERFVPTLVRTGLVPKIPDGYEIQVRPRSGMALKRSITVWNSPGTVDQGYKNEIGVILLWAPNEDYVGANDCAEINAGDRIAQFVLAPVTKCKVCEVEDVGESDRSKVGHDGFGSTGK